MFRPRRLSLAGMALVIGSLWSMPAAAEPLSDPAVLAPADAAVYVEAARPGHLLASILDLFRGTVMENPAEALAHWKLGQVEGLGNRGLRLDARTQAALGLLNRPMIEELKKIQSAAVAVRGFDPEEGPWGLAVLLPGGSDIPAALLQSMLLTKGAPVEAIGDTMLYKFQGPNSPLFAVLDRAILGGRPRAAVAAAVRRAAESRPADSLAHREAFSRAAKAHRPEAGLFVYVDGPRVNRWWQEVKENGPSRLTTRHLPSLLYAANLAAADQAVAALTLDDGTLRLTGDAWYRPAATNSAYLALPRQPLDRQILGFVPREAAGMLAINLADGPTRWAAALEAADAIIRLELPAAAPAGLPLSGLARGIQASAGLDLGRDLFGNLRGAAVVVQPASTGEPGAADDVALVLQARNPQALQTLTDRVLPGVVALVWGKSAGQPKEQEVAGQRLQVFATPSRTVASATSDLFLVVSGNPELAAAILAAHQQGRTLLNSAWLDATDHRAGVLALVNPEAVVRMLRLENEPWAPALKAAQPATFWAVVEPDHIQGELRIGGLAGPVRRLTEALLPGPAAKEARAVKKP